jgi:N-dimethylarginine dimethylaminohydrolase
MMSAGDSHRTSESGDMPARHRLLMCAPDAYDLAYEINDWMSLQNRPDLKLAARQWRSLYETLTGSLGVAVELIPQMPGAPDMVFTANAGLIAGNRVLLANFKHPERQVEVAPFRAWFERNGYACVAPPPEFHFEGEGDALYAGDTLVAGYLKRSDIQSHRWLSEQLGAPVLSVELVSGRWYHLDTAFFALTPELVVYYPGAFDEYARIVLERNFETIRVVEEEALQFACNAVVLGRDVVMPAGCPLIRGELEARGYKVHPVELSEFLKSGGAAKCLVLFLDRQEAASQPAQSFQHMQAA